jgi:hypothetical protein
MTNHQQNDPGSAATETLGLTRPPHKVPSGNQAEVSVPSILDHSVRQIKCQMIGDLVFDLIRLGRQQPDYLETTLTALDDDCRSSFLRQLSKRIENGDANK